MHWTFFFFFCRKFNIFQLNVRPGFLSEKNQLAEKKCMTMTSVVQQASVSIFRTVCSVREKFCTQYLKKSNFLPTKFYGDLFLDLKVLQISGAVFENLKTDLNKWLHHATRKVFYPMFLKFYMIFGLLILGPASDFQKAIFNAVKKVVFDFFRVDLDQLTNLSYTISSMPK